MYGLHKEAMKERMVTIIVYQQALNGRWITHVYNNVPEGMLDLFYQAEDLDPYTLSERILVIY
jgi:hypothetical protein